jgi:hypothetical protein
LLRFATKSTAGKGLIDAYWPFAPTVALRIGRAPIRARLRESKGHGQMKRAALTEEQIIGVLREREASAGRKSRIIAAF